VVERFFLNWINAKAGGAAITGQNDAIFTGLTDKTKTSLARSQLTKAGT
jgi:hypothetical protein